MIDRFQIVSFSVEVDSTDSSITTASYSTDSSSLGSITDETKDVPNMTSPTAHVTVVTAFETTEVNGDNITTQTATSPTHSRVISGINSTSIFEEYTSNTAFTKPTSNMTMTPPPTTTTSVQTSNSLFEKNNTISSDTGTAINNVTQTSHHSSSTVTITTTSSPQDSESDGRPMVTNSPATSSTNTPPYTTHASSQNTPDRDSNVSTRAAITHTMGDLVSSPVVDSWTAVVYIPNPDTMFLTDTHVMYFEYCSNKDGAVYLQIYRPTKGHNYVLYSSVYHKAENAGYHKVEVRA